MRLETALADLGVRNAQQPVVAAPRRWRPLLQRYAAQVDVVDPGAPEQGDRVGAVQPDQGEGGMRDDVIEECHRSTDRYRAGG